MTARANTSVHESIHHQAVLQPFIAEQFGCKSGDMPVTDSICKGTIALPFHNNLSAVDVELVCTELKSCLDEIDKQ